MNELYKKWKIIETLSFGTELKSPAKKTDGAHSCLSDTRVLNWANRDNRYLACASLTSANSGSLTEITIYITTEKKTSNYWKTIKDKNTRMNNSNKIISTNEQLTNKGVY